MTSKVKKQYYYSDFKYKYDITIFGTHKTDWEVQMQIYEYQANTGKNIFHAKMIHEFDELSFLIECRNIPTYETLCKELPLIVLASKYDPILVKLQRFMTSKPTLAQILEEGNIKKKHN